MMLICQSTLQELLQSLLFTKPSCHQFQFKQKKPHWNILPSGLLSKPESRSQSVVHLNASRNGLTLTLISCQSNAESIRVNKNNRVCLNTALERYTPLMKTIFNLERNGVSLCWKKKSEKAKMGQK